MKVYIILALLVGFSLQDGTCQTWTCGSLTNACVGKTATANGPVTVQACSSGNYCQVPANTLSTQGIQQFSAALMAADTTCAANGPAPGPYTPKGLSGDRCSKDTDCKTAGFTCKSNACRNAAAVKDAVCAAHSDCDVGFYCNNLKCAAVIAPGAACTATTQGFDAQCGFGSYCLNSVCAPLYSQAIGTVIPGATNIAQVCATGYQAPDDGQASTTQVCSTPNKNTNDPTKGMATSAACPVTVTPFKGAAFQSANPPTSVCGYNQDANFYCPWQQGDTVPLAAIQALTPIFAYAAANCNPQRTDMSTIADCGAVFTKYPLVLETYAKAIMFVNGVKEIGPLVVNNAGCVKTAVTTAYWGFSSSVYGMIGAFMAVFAMMI